MIARSAFLFAVTAVVCAPTLIAGPALVPRPARLEAREGRFPVTARTRIVTTPEERTGALLSEWIAVDSGLRLQSAAAGTPRAGNIVLRKTKPAGAASESYTLRIAPDGVEIESSSTAGVVFACQTLRQLLVQEGQEWTLPAMDIQDSPRLAWRGLMMDCSRTFLPISYLERTIDLMSYHKLNVLHLHLTDDQGWRVEIKKHPKLTDIGSRFAARYAGERGGYYSQEELRRLIRYAADRGIAIVPEIETPGHSLAALAAYPELSCAGGPFEVFPYFSGPAISEDVFCPGNEGTYRLLEDVLNEVSDIFPEQYVHIGGDECPHTRWQKCPKCQARIRAEGLKDDAALHGYLVKRLARVLEARNKKLIGWDEIAEGGAAPDATVMFWRGVEGVPALTKAGHDVVLGPLTHCYLDFRQSDLPQETGAGPEPTPLDKVYSFDPVPPTLEAATARHILGGQGNMWTHIARTEDSIDRQIFPRLAALAEVFWTPQELRRWADFRSRMEVHCRRLAKMHVKLGVNFHPDPGVWADPVRSKP